MTTNGCSQFSLLAERRHNALLLDQAAALAAANSPVEEWPDAVLLAYCDASPAIFAQLSDGELAALIAAEDDAGRESLLADYQAQRRV